MVEAYIDLYVKTQHATMKIMRIPQEELLNFGFKRPHAFLRHVLFTVCGTKGHLFIDGVDSQPIQVDYDSVDIREKYIYISDPATAEHAFIDIDGLDKVSSSLQVLTPRRLKLRNAIVKRDGKCLISGFDRGLCKLVHIIPHSKGDEYISRVVQLRSDTYPDEVGPGNEINSVENALLLRADFHRAFGLGFIAFIKVPNFSMTCEDIPYVDPPPPIPAPETRICAIEIHKISGDQLRLRWITSGWDLIFTGTKVKDIPPPSTMLFDFHFGLSCYKRWGVLDSKDFLRTYRRDHYENIPVVYSAFQAPEDDHDDSSALEDGITMEESMDHIMWLMLELRGLTPEVRKEMAQRRQEEEQLKSRQKVMEWMEASEPGVAESPPEDTH